MIKPMGKRHSADNLPERSRGRDNPAILHANRSYDSKSFLLRGIGLLCDFNYVFGEF